MNNFQLQKATYYYYALLSGAEKEFYEILLYAVLHHNEVVDIQKPITKTQIGKIIDFLRKDRPDIFWLDNGYTMTTQNNVIVKLTLKYTLSKNEIEQTIRLIENSRFYKELNSIIASQRSSFDKALATYEYIIKYSEYETRALASNSSYYNYAYEIYGVVLNSRAVCSGYAKTFQYFMNKHDVFCTVTTGETKKGRHAWNLINLYGDYYYIDATWGDPIFEGGSHKDPNYISYDYFCITTNDLIRSHSPILDNEMPLCNSVKYNYYNFFGLIENVYTVESVARQILNAKKASKSEAQFRYSSYSAYKTAIDRLFNRSEVFEALRIASNYDRSINASNVRYSVNDEKYQIIINI